MYGEYIYVYVCRKLIEWNKNEMFSIYLFFLYSSFSFLLVVFLFIGIAVFLVVAVSPWQLWSIIENITIHRAHWKLFNKQRTDDNKNGKKINGKNVKEHTIIVGHRRKKNITTNSKTKKKTERKSTQSNTGKREHKKKVDHKKNMYLLFVLTR